MDGLTEFGDWLLTRIKNIDIFDEHYQLEAHSNPFYALGPIFYLVWFIVMATGLILIMWYIPTKAQAFNTIFDIQSKIPFGGLIRGMHKYGADAMIIAATMRVYRMFLAGDYKQGKELNIAIGLVALLLSMYSGLTGYLLIWNQRAFWATKVFATFPTYMDQFPVMGDFYQPLVKSLHLGWNTAEVLLGGGAAITQETITRFFSLHLAFSLIPLIFVELYFYKNAYKRVPLNWTKRIIITLMLVIVAIILPAAQGRRSNPDVTPLPILSDWYFLGLYQMYKYLEPVVATEITLVIPLSVIAIPFLDSYITGVEKDIMKRPLVLMTTLMGFFCWIIFSYLIIINVANIHNDPPYWRVFLYGMVDVGVLWQLALMWFEKNPAQRAKNVRPAIIMGSVMLIQSVLTFAYYLQAKTEMFLDPLMHAGVYSVVRPTIPNAQALEDATRKLVPSGTVLPFNEDFLDIAKEIYVPKVQDGQKYLDTLESGVKEGSALDLVFKAIPTFTPNKHPEYLSTTDYMVVNRWMYDYVTLTDRLTPGVCKSYPMEVPELDWIWMIAGPVACIACFAAAGSFKSAKPETPAPQPVASASA
jgi:quinol-cytochrome oxidoreductase complex cytochrome b subunit